MYKRQALKIALRENDNQSLCVGLLYIDNYEEALESVEEVKMCIRDRTWKIEDLSVSMINSRKISARSMITLTLQSDQLYDEEAAVDLTDAEGIEFHKKQMDITSLAVCKRDIYRIRQDMELPASMPNFYHVIWQSIRIASIDMRPLEEKIAISGELSVFLLYESMQDGDHQYYETTLPFLSLIHI